MPPKIKYFFLDYHSVLNQGQYYPPTPKWYSAMSGDSFDCQDKKNTTGIWRVETGMLINILQCTGWFPHKEISGPKCQ